MPNTAPRRYNPNCGRSFRRTVLGFKVLLIAGIAALAGFASGQFKAGAADIAYLHVLALAGILGVVAWRGLSAFRRRGFGAGRQGGTRGTVIHNAARYEFLVRIWTIGREGRFRRRLLAPAKLQPGENLLEVGCGTGSLTIIAKGQVGDRGSVTGLDASKEMVARARLKAARAGLGIDFVQGLAEALPFDAAQFDAVVGTLMLHHVAKPARAAFVQEARRVLKPTGRLVLVDFGRSGGKPKAKGLHRHGHVDMEEFQAQLEEGGFKVEEAGSIGYRGLEFVVAVPRRAAPPLTSAP